MRQENSQEAFAAERKKLQARIDELEKLDRIHKQTEGMLKESEQRFRLFFEYNKDAIFVADPATRMIIDCNLKAEELTGRSKGELLKSQVDSLHPPECREEAMGFFKRVSVGEEIIVESMILSQSGRRIPVSITAGIVKPGDRALLIGTFRDTTERRQNEELLMGSKKQFEELFENIGTGVAIYQARNDGQDFVFVNINKAGEKLSKVKREDVIGKSVLEVFPAIKSIGLFNIFQQVWKTGQSQHQNVTLYHDQRISQWVENYVYKLPSGEIIAVYEDVTERKLMEENLQKSKDYLNNIINTVADPIFVKDIQHRMVLVNDAECALTGYPREKVIGKTDYDFFPKEQVDVFWAKDEELLKTGQENINEEEITDASGNKKVIVTKKTLYTDGVGNKFIVGIIRDITERKNMEKALCESEERFRSVVANAGEWIWETDPHGRYIYCSPAVEHILGFKPEELLGKYFYDLFPADVREKYKAAAFEVLARKDSFSNFLNQNIHQDGRVVLLETSGLPVIDAQGRFLGYRGIDRDVTELKKAERALKENENLLNEVGDIAKVGGWEMDLATGKATWTKATYDIVEIEYDQPIPGLHEHVAYYLPEYREMISEKMKNLIVTKQQMSFEAQAKTAKGNIKWFRAVGEAVEVDGKVVKLRGILQDISERKAAEQANIKYLKELEIFYKASVGREERILELKKEVERLKKELG